MRTHAIVVLAALSSLMSLTGCQSESEKKPVEPPPRYVVQPPRVVPDWLKGSIFEQVDLSAVEPFRVSNYGLVLLKQPTGDARNVPYPVREFMIREMQKRGFGNQNYTGVAAMQPETILQSPYAAIVRVDAFIPPGAAKGSRIDVQVSALDNSDTTSLAGGTLYTTDLYPGGANQNAPGKGIDLFGTARGFVFVNPAYALDGGVEDPIKRRSLTNGVVMAGGFTTKPRPIVLNIRSAEKRLSRMTEKRIQQLFNDQAAAVAQDEGRVAINMPAKYRGNWEHFCGVVLHTYWIDNDGFAASKAIELAGEAQKDGALLLDISYTWEALGRPALSAIQPLYTHSKPEIAFAAARAGAFIGDGAAELALASMAADASNTFRSNAVKTLVALPNSPAVNAHLRSLAQNAETTVRIEAYLGLARNADPAIQSWQIGNDPDLKNNNNKFKLDILQNDGPPLVFATRTGQPRIAFIGDGTRLPTPTFFSAMSNALTISGVEQRNDMLSIYYRGPGSGDPIQQLTWPDAADLVSRLGGGPANLEPDGQKRFDFTYGEVVAILSRLNEQQLLLAKSTTDAPSTFVLQDPPSLARDLESAPVIPEGPRPISDAR